VIFTRSINLRKLERGRDVIEVGIAEKRENFRTEIRKTEHVLNAKEKTEMRAVTSENRPSQREFPRKQLTQSEQRGRETERRGEDDFTVAPREEFKKGNKIDFKISVEWCVLMGEDMFRSGP